MIGNALCFLSGAKKWTHTWCKKNLWHFTGSHFFLDNYKAEGISALRRMHVIGWTNANYLLEKHASVMSTSASFCFSCKIPISVFLNTNTVREWYLSQMNLLWILIQSKFLLFQRGTFSSTWVLSFALPWPAVCFLLYGGKGVQTRMYKEIWSWPKMWAAWNMTCLALN